MPGINQVGGNGGQINFEDNTNADAAGLGAYWLDTIYAKSVANGWKALDGVTAAIERWLLGIWAFYFFHVTLQNGDGGSSATTFKATNAALLFESTKQYLISTTGLINRWTEFGTPINETGADAVRYAGCEGVLLVCSVAGGATLRGNARAYGSKLVNVAGPYHLNPQVAGATFEVVDHDEHSQGSNVQMGVAAFPLTLVRNLVSAAKPTNAPAMNNFNVTDCELFKSVLLPGHTASSHLRTGAAVRAREMQFFGQASQDVFVNTGGSSADWDIVDPEMSQVTPQSSVQTRSVRQWRTYQHLVLDGSAAPLAGIEIRVTRQSDLAVVASGTSDSRGRFTFGAGVTAKSIIVAEIPSGSIPWQARGPFTVEVNVPGMAAYNPQLPSDTFPVSFPSKQGAINVEYGELSVVTVLRNAATVAQEFFEQDDAVALLEDGGGQDVSFGATTVKGIYEQRTVDMEFEGVEAPQLGVVHVVLVQTGALPGLQVGNVVSVAGIDWTVRDMRQVYDGVFTELFLAGD